jgi:acyl-homoserine lactone acylase PvdQ
MHYDKEAWHEEEFVGSAGGIGSNCWVVSGEHSKSGKPILSCDPHLNK